jgi:hypothetical protein
LHAPVPEVHMADLWDDEDQYWRSNYTSRPYASGRDYDSLRGGYRYGYESASRHKGRNWTDVERDLESGWNSYEHRGQSTWQQVKDAARDAWDRVTGKK